MIPSIRAGLTLVELSIAATIFAMIAGVAGQSLASGTRLSAEVSSSSTLTEDTNRVLQRIAGQLRSADYNWIYLNEGEVSTYTFRVCTGLGTSDSGEIGPRFDNTYTIAYDSIDGTLSATLVNQATGSILSQEIARDLRTPDGFRVGQLGTDVLVKGNQLQLAMVRQAHLADGTELVREATTTVFLRSTIYANTNLTTTSIDLTDETNEDLSDGDIAPMILLDSDTDTSQKVIDRKLGIYANNLLIKGSVTMPAGGTSAIDWNTFDLRSSKTVDGESCSLEVTRGWVTAENRSGKLLSNEFVISGWVIGSLTITVAVESSTGGEGSATQAY